MHRLFSLALAALAVACDKPVDVCPATPDADLLPAVGDGNLDTVVDVADIVLLSRHVLLAEQSPGCSQALDVAPDADLNANDASALWLWLYGADLDLEPLPDGACLPPQLAPETPDCGRVAYSIDASKKEKGEPGATVAFTASVSLHSPDLDVHAWSLSIATTGCTVAAATTDGTVGADRWLDASGQRGMGFGIAEPTQDPDPNGAVSAVVLSWLEDAALSASEDPYPVLSLTIEATAPDSGCEICTSALDDGRQGSGQPVRSIISHQGFAYLPEPIEVEVKVCKG